MSAKDTAIDQLMFSMPRNKRLDVERAIHGGKGSPILSITNMLVKNIKPGNAGIVQALLPYLKLDCVQASMAAK